MDKWYSPAYNFDFKDAEWRYDRTNGYSMVVMLWDSVDRVGCAKSCCSGSEIIICDFLPTIIEPTILDVKMHVKPNKYIKK